MLVMILAKTKRFMFSAAQAACSLWKSAVPTDRRQLVPSRLSNCLSAFRTRNGPSVFLCFLIARIAESKALGFRTVAQLAQFLGVSAFSAKLLEIFRSILAFPNIQTTVRTLNSVVHYCLSVPVVMFDTKSEPEIGVSADFTHRFWPKSCVQSDVLRMIRKQLQILWSIILWIKVDVMHFLWRNQESSKGVFDYDNVLCNESSLIASGMVRFPNHHISISRNVFVSAESIFHVHPTINDRNFGVNTSSIMRYPT